MTSKKATKKVVPKNKVVKVAKKKPPVKRTKAKPRRATGVAAGLPSWEWQIRWSELVTVDKSAEHEEFTRKASKLEKPELGTKLYFALGWGLNALGDDVGAARPALLEPLVSTLPNAWVEHRQSDRNNGRALIISSAVLSALGFGVVRDRKLRATVKAVMKHRKNDIAWVREGERAEFSAALCYFDFYEEAAVWSDAGKILKRPRKGAAYPWSVQDSLRYFASAYAAGLSPADTQDAWSEFVRAFPRKCLLRQLSLRALLIAAGDRRRRFHEDLSLADLLAAEGVRCVSGLRRQPKAYVRAESSPHIKQESFRSWRAAATLLRADNRVASLQVHTSLRYRHGGLNKDVTNYMASLGLVAQLQGQLSSHLTLMSDLLPSLVDRYAGKSEFWRYGLEPLLIIPLLEAFGLDHPPTLSFPVSGVTEWAEKCRSKEERPKGSGRARFDLAAAAYLGADSKWWPNPPATYEGEAARVTCGEFLQAFHQGSSSARALGVRLVEEIPPSTYFRLADALLVARVIGVQIDGRDPCETGELLRELTGIQVLS